MSIVGTWNVTINSPMGEAKSTLTLNADGTGTAVSDRGSSELSNVKIDGDTASYSIEISAMGQKMKLDVSAKADGDNITGRMNTAMGGADFTGQRAS